MIWCRACLAVLCCATAACAGREALLPLAPLSPRDRVRIVFVSDVRMLRHPVREALIGEFVGADEHAVHLRVAAVADPLIVPLNSIHAAYRSTGRQSRIASAVSSGAKRAAFGAFTGLLVGALIPNDDRMAHIVVTRAAGAGVVGFVIGVILPSERWESARYERPSR